MSVEQMIWWLKWSMAVICIVTSAFPIWYGFANKWWTTKAGQSILFLSVGVAAAWDLTYTFNFIWFPSSYVWPFWIQMCVHTYTILAGLYLLYVLWYNRRHGTMVTVENEEKEQ